MSTTKEAVYALGDDKQELQKQLGCMNGIFQIFDRRYLLGQRRHGHNQKTPPPDQMDNGEKKISNASEQAKGKTKTPKLVTKENQRASIESSRNSCSSSSSSTILSSLDCSKRVQTEQSSSSPSLHRKKPDLFIQSPDIRDVVKDSMTRETRVVSIKTVTKDERTGPPMKHIDSPRPFPDQKPDKYNRNDRNLAKLREFQWAVKEVKETSRVSCDGRETRNLSKSNVKVKELPRLSLDSRLSRESQRGADMDTPKSQTHEPRSNKRPSSSVVARLMGLEVLTSSIDKNVILKTKPCLSEESRSSKTEELKSNHNSVSPRVRKGLVPPTRVSHAITRIPLETAPWKQEGGGRGSQKPPFKSKEAPGRTEPASTSIYDEIEKRLTGHEYKTAGKDLRALKHILEAMQKTRSRLENIEHASENSIIHNQQGQKSHQPVSPTFKGISPIPPRRHVFLKTDTKVKRISDSRKDLIGRQQSKDPTPRDRKASKHSMRRAQFGSTNRNPKAKSMDTLQDRVQPHGYNAETRNSSQHSDTVSFQSESNSLNDSEVTSTQWLQEVNSMFRPKSNIAERLTQDKPMADHGKHTMEQPSPVSVLDAFYTEDTPSPIKKRLHAFSDDENLHLEEALDQARMNNIANRSKQYQYSGLNDVKLENIKDLVHGLLNTKADDATVDHAATSPCENENQDHRYIMEIALASGILKHLDRTTTVVQLHPTSNLINPQLFHVLEKTKGCTELTNDEHRRKSMISKSNEKIRRKLVFDTVNDVLGHKLAMVGPFGPRTKGTTLNGDKLLKELCLGIDSLENSTERGGIYDEDDEVVNIINADVNKRSQDWDECCHEVPGLVIDIERLIFKDLISEVVNAQPARHRRQLFPV